MARYKNGFLNNEKSFSLLRDTTIVSIYVSNCSKYTHQKLTELKEEIENSTITVKSFTIPLSIMGRTTRQRII